MMDSVLRLLINLFNLEKEKIGTNSEYANRSFQNLKDT